MSAAEDRSGDIELEQAQAALEQARNREARRAERDRVWTLGESLDGAIPAAGRYTCNTRCGTQLERPGICDECARRAAAQALETRLRSWLRTIPARQRDVTWSTLPTLKADRGGPRVTGNITGVRRMLERCDRAAIVGTAGSGKTTVAVAWLRAELEADPSARVRFIPTADLLRPEVGEEGGPHPLALALSADVLVLDDLGAELEGAQERTGLLAQRIGPASRVIAERYEKGRRTVVTTGENRDRIALLYGDRVARRMFEAAAVIRLGGGA
jgi:hypothetical protein